MNDPIDRQQAIDAVRKCSVKEVTPAYILIDKAEAMTELMCLPSAEPEIIHCGDCRYKDDGIDEDGIPFLKCLNGRSYGCTRINDYCSWAERRTDE